MRRECPECKNKWARRQGAAAGQRASAWLSSHWDGAEARAIESARYKAAKADPEASAEAKKLYSIRSYHVTITWKDRDLESMDDVRELRKDVYRIANEHGIFGGCCVLHTRGPDDEGAHGHVLGFAGFISPGDNEEIIFKVIPRKDKNGNPVGWVVRNQYEREGVVFYNLTHCIIASDDDVYLHALTWFGMLAYNKFSQDIVARQIAAGFVDDRSFEPECPRCHSTNVEKEYLDDYTAWPPCRVHVET